MENLYTTFPSLNTVVEIGDCNLVNATLNITVINALVKLIWSVVYVTACS